MKKINIIIYLQLFVVLLCCIGTISAASSDTMDNIVSDSGSNNEIISVNDGELACDMDESVLSAQDGNLSTNDILKDDDGFEDDDCDEDDFEDDDADDELDDAEINEILEDIKLSTSGEYYDFVKSLLDTKKFSFNSNSIVDDGYKLFAINKYEKKLYDGGTHKLDNGGYYFVSTCSGLDLYVECFYPDTFHYNENDDVVFDKLYYTWQDSQTDKYINYDYIKETSTPKRYDLRDTGYVTSVKNQQNKDNCWAFASVAALESYLLKNEGKTYDFSENNLKNAMSSIGSIGNDIAVDTGGTISMSIAYFLRWSGPILEKDDGYMSNNLVENLNRLNMFKE